MIKLVKALLSILDIEAQNRSFLNDPVDALAQLHLSIPERVYSFFQDIH